MRSVFKRLILCATQPAHAPIPSCIKKLESGSPGIVCMPPSLGVADGWVLISSHGAGDKTFKVNIDGLQLSHHTRLMGLGRVLALDSGPAHWWYLYPLAAPCVAPDFLFVEFAGGEPSYGAAGEGWPQPRQADGPT